MVFDIPADQGGALSILKDFYEEISTVDNADINWFFVISTPVLDSKDNIQVLNFPKTKKSWAHRLYFDYVIAPKLVKDYHIDKILSLQNVTIPYTSVHQILYVHQPLPFTSHRYTFKDNKYFWTYQNIIGKKIIASIKKASHVVVQTEWMKQSIVVKTKIEENIIDVVSPDVKITIDRYFDAKDKSFKTFFFPGGDLTYKNHQIIVDATLHLVDRGYHDFSVKFTLEKDNAYAAGLAKEAEDNNLPVSFLGKIPREKVYELYRKSVLVFPSYIETFGLPLLEAMRHKGMILASDQPFSREILQDYENARFFNCFDSKGLADLMESVIVHGKENYREVDENNRVGKATVKLSEIVSSPASLR